MLTCYIVDDDDYAVDALTAYAEKLPFLSVIGSSTSPIEAVEELNQGLRPDILFLDVEMPDLSGLNVIEMISKDISVVFTTGHCNYAFDAFEKDVVDFLLKPVTFEKFAKAVSKIQQKKNFISDQAAGFEEPCLYINSGGKGKIVKINLAEIIFVESNAHNVCIQTHEENFRPSISIKDIQKQLPAEQFVRVHKSFIININKIKEITSNQITLSEQYCIPIGDTHREAFLSRIAAKTLKKS